EDRLAVRAHDETARGDEDERRPVYQVHGAQAWGQTARETGEVGGGARSRRSLICMLIQRPMSLVRTCWPMPWLQSWRTRAGLVSASWRASAVAPTSKGFTVRHHSPSSSWAPAFSESTSTPSRSFTTMPSLDTRFIPS